MAKLLRLVNLLTFVILMSRSDSKKDLVITFWQITSGLLLLIFLFITIIFQDIGSDNSTMHWEWIYIYVYIVIYIYWLAFIVITFWYSRITINISIYHYNIPCYLYKMIICGIMVPLFLTHARRFSMPDSSSLSMRRRDFSVQVTWPWMVLAASKEPISSTITIRTINY